MSKDVKKKLLFVLLAIAVMLVIGFVPAETEAMSRTAWQYLGIFGLMLVLLITAALPDWATCLAVLALLVVFKIGTVSEVMSQFGSSTVWLVIGIFTLSIGLNNSGFLKRIALWIVTKFPGTYRGQVTAMFVSGLITSPLIPSSLAKTGVLSPLTAQGSESSGIEPSSKPALGIWTACFMPTYYFGCAFMSGSAYVALMIGFMGGMEFTWGSWFSALWPWLVVSIVLTYIFCAVICKPKQTTATFSTEFIKEQYKALGPMSKKEKQGIVILLVCLILWLTQSVHKIDAGMVALLGSAAMAFCGLITTPDLCAKGQWNLIIFIGGGRCQHTQSSIDKHNNTRRKRGAQATMKKYTKEHQWIEIAEGVAKVGITHFAADELGEITFVELPQVGTLIHGGEPLCVIESVKAASDVFMPVTGTVESVNEELDKHPEMVNDDPEGNGWICTVKDPDEAAINTLLSEEEYKAFVG